MHIVTLNATQITVNSVGHTIYSFHTLYTFGIIVGVRIICQPIVFSYLGLYYGPHKIIRYNVYYKL